MTGLPKKRQSILEVRDVFKSFNGLAVLEGLSLEIERGSTVAIIGGSGCGKTVLLKHFIGLLKPDSGRVFVDSLDITPLKEHELRAVRRRFGMLFQGSALFDSLSVEENVAFPLREHTGLSESEIRKVVEEKLDLVGLPGVLDKYPSELSGGMKKRVGLARAIALGPEVLLYDEPTTGLDPVLADVINELILKMSRTLGVTTILVTHDIKSACKVADEIAMLHAGRIIEETTPGEIQNSKNPIVRQFILGRSEAEESLRREDHP